MKVYIISHGEAEGVEATLDPDRAFDIGKGRIQSYTDKVISMKEDFLSRIVPNSGTWDKRRDEVIAEIEMEKKRLSDATLRLREAIDGGEILTDGLSVQGGWGGVMLHVVELNGGSQK